MNQLFITSFIALMTFAFVAPSAGAFGSVCEDGIGGRVDVCVNYGATGSAVYAPDPYTTGNRDEVCVSQNTCVTYPEVEVGRMYVTSLPVAHSYGSVTVHNCFKAQPCTVDWDTRDIVRSLAYLFQADAGDGIVLA